MPLRALGDAPYVGASDLFFCGSLGNTPWVGAADLFLGHSGFVGESVRRDWLGESIIGRKRHSHGGESDKCK